MKKNKLCLIFSILTIILIFGTAAICNQCGYTIAEKTETTAKAEISINETTSGAVQAQETIGEASKGAKPTVNIERVYGPVMEGNICVQRFKAKITGIPKPGIKWNHDDSNGAFGEDMAQVNLKSGEEFDLNVTAANSAGSATAAIHVKYELAEKPSAPAQPVSFIFDPKSGPEGTEVTLKLSAPIDSPVTVYFGGQQVLWVIFTKTASPDGKTLKVNIPAGAVSDYFKLEYDGKIIKAAEQFIVAAPPQADLAITNVRSYSSTALDTIIVDIKNIGTADLNNTGIHVVCQTMGIGIADPTKSLPAGSDQTIYFTIKAGESDYFFPYLKLDFGLYIYPAVGCSIYLDGDPTPGNNEFVISIP